MVKTPTELERLGVPLEAIADFCRRWGVAEFALFGSAVRDDFGPDSDVDVLITFAQRDAIPDREAMRAELQALFGRKVDVVYRRVIEASRNYIIRKSILRSARIIYAA